VTEYAPYQGGAFSPPPAHAGPVRPLRNHAWIAMGALGIIGLEALVAAALLAYLFAAEAAATEPTSEQLALQTFLYEREQGVAAALLVVAGIAFVGWLHRARTNLDGRDGPELTWKRGWTVGGWLVPLGNLVIPQLVVGEVDRVSEEWADESEGRPHERHRGVLTLWVVLWSLHLVAGRFADNAPTELDPGPATLLGVAWGLFQAVTAGSAVLLVWQITAHQERARIALARLAQAPAAQC